MKIILKIYRIKQTTTHNNTKYIQTYTWQYKLILILNLYRRHQFIKDGKGRGTYYAAQEIIIFFNTRKINVHVLKSCCEA